MLRKLLVVLMLLLVVVPAVEARRRTPTAGNIEDDVYTDSKYDFQLTIPEGWKPSVNKEGDHARLVLTQKKYDIPLDYINVPHYTWVPTLTVFVDTAEMNLHIFIDSLLTKEYDSDTKKAIEKEFEFLSQQEIIPKGRTRLEVAGESGVLWIAQAKYTKIVQTSASSVGGKRVYGNYGGAIAAVEHNGHMYMFFLMCEWNYFDSIMAEVEQIISSLKFVPQEEEGQKKK